MNQTKQTAKNSNKIDKLSGSNNKSISVKSKISESQENFTQNSQGRSQAKSSYQKKKQVKSQKSQNRIKVQSEGKSMRNVQKQKGQNDNKYQLKKLQQKEMLYSQTSLIKPSEVANQKTMKQAIVIQNQEIRNESNKKHEKLIEQIQNEIRINNLESKVVSYHTVNSNPARQIEKLDSSESQVVQSPIVNKQSEVYINLNEPNRKKSENVFKLQRGLVKIQSKDKETIKEQKSLLDLDSEEEKEINKIVIKQIEQQSRMKPNDKKKLKIVKIQSEVDYKIAINQRQKYSLDNKDNESDNKNFNLGMGDATHRSQRQIELQTLRQAVKELRLQNFKIKSQKQSWLSTLQQNFKKMKPESSGRSNQSIEITNRQRNKSTSQPGKTRLFGRISRNISAAKKRSECGETNLQKKSISVNKVQSIPLQDKKSNDKLTAGHQVRRYLEEQSERKKGRLQQPYTKQYRTMELTKIEEQHQLRIVRSEDVPELIDLEINQILNQNRINMRGNEICSKLLDKFESNHKKFRKFMTREQIKTKQKMQKLFQDNANKTVNPQILKKGQTLLLNDFEGTIIKNISRPIEDTKNAPAFIRNGDADYINVKTLALIVQADKKVLVKKKIKFSKITVPKFPEPPSHDITIEQMMKLIKQVLLIYSEIDFPSDFIGCSLKKYKNCIMFQLPSNDRFRIVWHFKGKLYIGEWNNQSNEKSGQGIEFVKDGYFYRGQFSSGKRYGEGLLVYANGSMYQGEFINGERYGKGKYFDSEDKSYYLGEWKNNKMEGLGYFEFDNNIFEGSFKVNMKHGFGVEQFHNGDKYMGEYAKDCFEGDGKYVWADGSVYIGQFKQNSRDGLGKWMSSQQNGEIYTGFYLKDKKHGSGKYIWSNGCMYEGNFDNDLKHGIGNLQYPDGRCAEGIWVQGILTEVISKLSETHLDQPLTLRKRKVSKRKTSKRKVPIEEGLD